MDYVSEALPDGGIRKLVRWGLYLFSWAILLAGFHLMWTTAREPRSI